jgi:hypothetical protein
LTAGEKWEGEKRGRREREKGTERSGTKKRRREESRAGGKG